MEGVGHSPPVPWSSGDVFLLEKSQKKIAIASAFPLQGNRKEFGGREGKDSFGPKKSLRSFHLRQKIAVAIAEKARHLVRSADDPYPKPLFYCAPTPLIVGVNFHPLNDHSFRNHDVCNSNTIKSCNCNCRKFLRIPEKNYFL